MAERKRRQFSPEFKVEAVRQVTEGKKPISVVARELGLRPDMLRSWRRHAEGKAGLAPTDVFPGNGKLPSEELEVRRLRRELEAARQEIAFLKKAATYFAKESR
jgi:transposase